MTIETIDDIHLGLHSGTTTAAAVLDRAQSRADAYDAVLGVFVSRHVAQAEAAATDCDRRLADGVPRPLEGVPVALKDVVVDEVGPTTAQSRVVIGGGPGGQREATLVTRLKDAGAVIVGKATTMEYSLGVPDPETGFPTPRNPWDPARWAGGSSSGCASGLAMGMFAAAVGTDTTGSIRVPAAYCGVTGLKPTAGLVPTTGVYPLAATLDTVGPMARSARDCAALLTVLAGHDGVDTGSVPRSPVDYRHAAAGDLRGVRIGVDHLTRYAAAGVDDAYWTRFDQAIGVLAEAGATVQPVELPLYQELSTAALLIMFAEAYELHAEQLAAGAPYGQGAEIVFSAGSEISAAGYLRAQRIRRAGRDRVSRLLSEVDLVVTPTAHLGAPLISGIRAVDPDTYLGSVHTSPWSVTGHPTLALPIGLSALGTPLSMSISGRHWDDGLVLRAGQEFQRLTDFHRSEPPMARDAVPKG